MFERIQGKDELQLQLDTALATKKQLEKDLEEVDTKIAKVLAKLRSVCAHEHVLETAEKETWPDGIGFPPVVLPVARVCEKCGLAENGPVFPLLSALPRKIISRELFDARTLALEKEKEAAGLDAATRRKLMILQTLKTQTELLRTEVVKVLQIDSCSECMGVFQGLWEELCVEGKVVHGDMAFFYVSRHGKSYFKEMLGEMQLSLDHNTFHTA